MTRIVLRAAVLLAAMGMGWAVARAQTAGPAFELVVDAPPGSTTVTCVRGCTLAWVQRGVNPNGRGMATFRYECKGAVERCSSGRVGGWIEE